jgi:hypothetical protein
MRDWLLDLEFRTTPETITKTAKDLGCEKKSAEGPVRFVGVSISELAERLSSVTGESSEASFGLEALILLRCLPMFHPHTALSLFKPKSPNLQAESNPENFPVAYLFSRDSTLLESEGQYSWLLLTEAGYQNALRSVENLLSCTSFIKNEYYQP